MMAGKKLEAARPKAKAVDFPGRVSVLHRQTKDGLGRAYAAGFTQALTQGADFIFQMDADFSHDPAALPDLLAPLVAGQADLVLGSRYVPGGGCPGWSLSRRLISRWGSFYARNLLRLSQRDLTGGFKGWRRELLAVINPGDAVARGYTFQIELTLRALRAGGRVREVPITFRERQAGTSKMSMKIALEAAWRVPALALSPPAVATFDYRALTAPKANEGRREAGQ